MKLFTAEIDKKLFAQYLKGSDLANQVVVAKIFNPYGRGTWYLLNSDPEDPEYLWAIVDLGDIEVGSVNRSDLENIRIKPFMLGLERDLSFTPMNAAEIYRGLNSGKTYAKGGVTMAHPKSYYQDLPSYNGYKWIGFDKGKHLFQKKESKGYSVIEALESDLTNGNIEFMAEHGLTNTNKKAEGGAIYKHKHMDATAKILEKTNKGYKVEFTDNSVRKPKAKIMYFNDIDFDKEKGYFEKMETGGGVGEYKLKDNVDFYYGRADEKKVISGTITDILNDGYTISTGFTQVMVKPNEIVGYSKQAEPKKKRFGIFKDGGGVNYLIEEEGNDEDRIKISIENIGESILVVSYPKYEFQEDLTEKEFDKIGLDEEEPIGKIEHIQVEDKEKGKGYAKLLMNKVIEVAKERGMFPLYLNASPMGSRGLNIEDLTEFYKSFGFKVFKKQGNNNLMLLEEKNIKLKKFADGGGVDINDWDMPVIRTQFEDEEYEFEKGGEVTADERMKSLKNYPKLKL